MESTKRKKIKWHVADSRQGHFCGS
jgi:hypothetical protein